MVMGSLTREAATKKVQLIRWKALSMQISPLDHVVLSASATWPIPRSAKDKGFRQHDPHEFELEIAGLGFPQRYGEPL